MFKLFAFRPLIYRFGNRNVNLGGEKYFCCLLCHFIPYSSVVLNYTPTKYFFNILSFILFCTY